MKLEVRNISKTYQDRNLINDFSFSFEDYCFYTICGESGCGKTTLLNILSLVINADDGAEINFNNENLAQRSENEKRDFRLKNIGYIFQSFNLFSDDTVFNNILVVLESVSCFSKNMKKRKIDEVLDEVGLLSMKNEYVRNLSGGEKQRVAIARALVNNPRIIFADEPTGSLDYKNSEIIFSILKKISANCLVICVTHDEDLAKKYSNEILRFKDGKIENTKNCPLDSKKSKNYLMIQHEKKNSGAIGEKFILRHFVNSFKFKKVRNIISTILLFLGLFSVGLATFLKSGISNSLKKSFSSIMNENSIILNGNNSNTSLIDYYSATLEEVKEIVTDYRSDIENYGTKYLVNIEEFFKSGNSLYNISRPNQELLDGYNARSFIDFSYVENLNSLENMYPKYGNKLENDEIILTMDHEVMIRICEYLQIIRNFEALGEYIRSGKFIVNLRLHNIDWQYYDNVSFKVKAVIPSNNEKIIHTNQFFNEYLLEERLMFPSSLDLKKIEEYPWVLKKIYFLKTNRFQSTFLNKIMLDEKYENILFDSDSEFYSPNLYSDGKSHFNNIVYVYNVYKNDLKPYLPYNFLRFDKNLNNFYYSTDGGYINLGVNLFSGFVNETLFSKDLKEIEEFQDAIMDIDVNLIDEESVPENVLEGNALKTGQNVVRFSTDMSNLISGGKPNNMSEICISSKMKKLLGVNNINEDIYLSMIYKTIRNDVFLENKFRTIKLRVVGFVDSDKVLIYNNSDFTISLFRDFFQISSFNLMINSIVYQMNHDVSKEEIDYLNSKTNSYKFINPVENMDLGIEETLGYLEYILIALAIVTIISAIALIIIINYIDILESKKDYAILAVLGFRNNEINNMQIFKILIPTIISFVLASINMVFLSRFLGKSISNSLGIESTIYLDVFPFISMFIIVCLIVFISSLISNHIIRHINVPKELHH